MPLQLPEFQRKQILCQEGRQSLEESGLSSFQNMLIQCLCTGAARQRDKVEDGTLGALKTVNQ